MYVCTGKLVAGGRRYTHGEPVPEAATWAPHIVAKLVGQGIIRNLSEDEAHKIAHGYAVDKAASERKGAIRRFAAAQLANRQAIDELATARKVVDVLKVKADLAASEEAKASAALGALPAAPKPVPALPAPVAVKVEPVKVDDIKGTAELRRLFAASIFGYTRGDLIAYAALPHKPAKTGDEAGPVGGPYDLSAFKKATKQEAQQAFVDAAFPAHLASLAPAPAPAPAPTAKSSAEADKAEHAKAHQTHQHGHSKLDRAKG